MLYFNNTHVYISFNLCTLNNNEHTLLLRLCPAVANDRLVIFTVLYAFL